MSLSNIQFVLGKGGLGRPLPGEDYISGLVWYNATLPAGFSANDRVKQLFSLEDAEALGIVGDYSDATAATGAITITAVGTDGNIAYVRVTDLDTGGKARALTLAAYTKVPADTTVALVAASIVALINAGTQDHGYSASNVAGVITIVAPKRFGVFLNTGGPLSITFSAGATMAGNVSTAFAGGVSSRFKVLHYQISEFFRIQPDGILWVGIFAVPGSFTAAEVDTMQTAATGAIRQLAIFKDAAAYSAGDIALIHAACQAQVDIHKELIALYTGDLAAVSNISTLANLSAGNTNLVSSVIAQDGAGLGNYLWKTTGKSVSAIGACLGTVALSKVSHSIAWVANYNMSNGYELDAPAFANGVLLSAASVNDNLLNLLQNYRHIFLRKFVGVAGSYWNENSSAISQSSDYAYQSDNRTMQKATRTVYKNLVPVLNGPITLNADGTLANESIAYLQGLCDAPLAQMVRDGELSAYSATIDPRQNILSTGVLKITVKLVQIATSRNIIVNIGYAVAV